MLTWLQQLLIQLERRQRWRFQSPSDFFGLQPDYKLRVHEEIFQLILHSKGGFSFSEVYNLPIYLRTFYLKRLQKFYKTEADEFKKEMNKYSDTIVVCPLTTSIHKTWRSRIQVNCAGKNSEIAVDQIRTISKKRLKQAIDTLNRDHSSKLTNLIEDMYC